MQRRKGVLIKEILKLRRLWNPIEFYMKYIKLTSQLEAITCFLSLPTSIANENEWLQFERTFNLDGQLTNDENSRNVRREVKS